MGLKNRERFHKTDWEAVSKNPELLGKPVGDWVLYHDPELYAYDNYTKCVSHVIEGTPFHNTNAVPGYTYKPWTVKELIDASDRGEKIVDEGNWA